MSNLLNGHAGLSAEMAIRFEKAFGMRADTMLRIQAAHDLAQARARDGDIRMERVRLRHLWKDKPLRSDYHKISTHQPANEVASLLDVKFLQRRVNDRLHHFSEFGQIIICDPHNIIAFIVFSGNLRLSSKLVLSFVIHLLNSFERPIQIKISVSEITSCKR